MTFNSKRKNPIAVGMGQTQITNAVWPILHTDVDSHSYSKLKQVLPMKGVTVEKF